MGAGASSKYAAELGKAGSDDLDTSAILAGCTKYLLEEAFCKMPKEDIIANDSRFFIRYLCKSYRRDLAITRRIIDCPSNLNIAFHFVLPSVVR